MSENEFKMSWKNLSTILGVILVLSVGMNIFLLVSGGGSDNSVSGRVITSTSTNTAGNSGSSGSAQNTALLQEIYEEIIPTGIPDVYGDELGISFDSPEASLNVIADLDSSIRFDSLSASQQTRYNEVAATPHSACEFCCGIGSRGFGQDGKASCGCAHNLGFSGLTKYLLQNHEDQYTNDMIFDEIQNWKALFFPKQTVAKVMEERGIDPTSAGLPDMVGGC